MNPKEFSGYLVLLKSCSETIPVDTSSTEAPHIKFQPRFFSLSFSFFLKRGTLRSFQQTLAELNETEMHHLGTKKAREVW